MLGRIKQELKQGKTLLRFGFLKATGQGLMMLVPLVVAGLFSEELFGRYSLAKMVPFFFVTVLITTFQAPFIVYANQERAKTGKINKSFSVQCIFFSFSLILFLLVSLAFPEIIMLLAKISKIELFFVLLAFIGLAIKVFLGNLCMALGQRIKDSFIELVFGVTGIAAVLFLHLIDKINLGAVFLVYFIGGILVLGLFVWTFDFKMLRPFIFDREYFAGMFHFAKWVVFGATAVYFINWADLLILRIFNVSMDQIGDYGLGYQVFKGLIVLTTVLSAYFMPFIAENINNPEKIRAYLYNKRPKIFLAGTVVIVFIFVGAPYIFRLVYGTAYQESVTVLRILLIAVVLVLYNLFYTPVLNALKKYKVYQIINIAQVIIKVLLNVILIPRFGLCGAAVGTVFSYFFRLVAIELYFRLRLRGILKI